MERKLASIRRVSNLEPIQGADFIEKATVDGWSCVVKKGEFAINDLVIYCEIDCWMPHELAPFLSKGALPREYNGVKGERLKTIRLKGCLSQGLLLPCSVVSLPEYIEGTDVTELLGIQKWEAPIAASLAGQVKGSFPSFISKTDQERAQNIVREIFEWKKGELYEVTTKLDGSSCTVYHKDGHVGVCSRNLELKNNEENAENSFVKTALNSGLVDLLLSLGKNIAVQMELMGPGIQGNREGFIDHKLFIFDIFDIDAQDYFLPNERHIFWLQVKHMLNETKIEHVPIITSDSEVVLCASDFSSIDELLKFADGHSVNHSVREGLVWKSVSNRNFSFKTISNTFLLQEK